MRDRTRSAGTSKKKAPAKKESSRKPRTRAKARKLFDWTEATIGDRYVYEVLRDLVDDDGPTRVRALGELLAAGPSRLDDVQDTADRAPSEVGGSVGGITHNRDRLPEALVPYHALCIQDPGARARFMDRAGADADVSPDAIAALGLEDGWSVATSRYRAALGSFPHLLERRMTAALAIRACVRAVAADRHGKIGGSCRQIWDELFHLDLGEESKAIKAVLAEAHSEAFRLHEIRSFDQKHAGTAGGAS